MTAKRKQSQGKSLARRKKASAPKNAILDMLNNMEPEVLQSLQQMFFGELNGAAGGGDSAANMFESYLTDCALGEFDDSGQSERLFELVGVLDQLRIDANGGDRGAREEIKEINALLAQTIERGDLDPADAIMIGKVFADAGWRIPEVLTRVLADSLSGLTSPGAPSDMPDFTATLAELAENVGHNPFDLHAQLISLIAAFPPAAAAQLLTQIVESGDSLAGQAAAGCLLHPDITVARATAQALTASATRRPVESVQVERLVRMRQWTPPDRHGFIDSAIRAMRANAAPPVPAPAAKTVACGASVCDGAGVRNVFVSQKVGGKYLVGTVMLKPQGVADAMLLTNLRKPQMDSIVEGLSGAAPTARVEVDAVARLLQLAVAENLASGTPPPFKLIEFAETLGFGPLPPDRTAPADLVAEILAGLPPEQTSAEAGERAHNAIAESQFAENWFEAGEELDALLAPVRAGKKREATILDEFLPGRRGFWVRQCALSAYALRNDDPSPHATWKLLALTGREIASEKPLNAMPLMRRVAQSSAMAYAASL